MPRMNKAATERQRRHQREATFQARATRALRAWEKVAATIRQIGTNEYSVNSIALSWAMSEHDEAMQHVREGTL